MRTDILCLRITRIVEGRPTWLAKSTKPRICWTKRTERAGDIPYFAFSLPPHLYSYRVLPSLPLFIINFGDYRLWIFLYMCAVHPISPPCLPILQSPTTAPMYTSSPMQDCYKLPLPSSAMQAVGISTAFIVDTSYSICHARSERPAAKNLQ